LVLGRTFFSGGGRGLTAKRRRGGAKALKSAFDLDDAKSGRRGSAGARWLWPLLRESLENNLREVSTVKSPTFGSFYLLHGKTQARGGPPEIDFAAAARVLVHGHSENIPARRMPFLSRGIFCHGFAERDADHLQRCGGWSTSRSPIAADV